MPNNLNDNPEYRINEEGLKHYRELQKEKEGPLPVMLIFDFMEEARENPAYDGGWVTPNTVKSKTYLTNTYALLEGLYEQKLLDRRPRKDQLDSPD